MKNDVLSINDIEILELILMEFYNVTILPRMQGTAAKNVLNGNQIFMSVRRFDFDKFDNSNGLINYNAIISIADDIAKIIGAKRENISEKDNNQRNYKKFFSYYDSFSNEIDKLSIRFAFGDYK